jgi:hypothetical protein
VELSNRFDVTDAIFENEAPTVDNRESMEVIGNRRLLELQEALASDRALFSMVDRLAAMQGDGRAVFEFLIGRHSFGERKYGPMVIATDTRDFELERCEEFGDSMIYAAAQFIQGGLAARRQRESVARESIARWIEETYKGHFPRVLAGQIRDGAGDIK